MPYPFDICFMGGKGMKKSFIALLLLTVACLPVLGASASAQGAFLTSYDEAATEAGSDLTNAVPGKVLVKFKEGKQSLSAGSGKGARASGWNNFRVHPLQSSGIGTVTFDGSRSVEDAMRVLSLDPNVAHVEPVYPVRALEAEVSVADAVYTVNDPHYNVQWGLSAIGYDDGYSYVSEEALSNIVIAVLDTGVDLDHPDLAGSLVPGYDYVNNDDTPADDRGHGTHVAGIAAATSNNGSGIAGVAGGAKIMPLKVLNEEGLGESSDVIEAIYDAVENGADLINLSLGIDSYSKLLEDAVNYAYDHGVLVVAASGNESNHWVGNVKGNLNYPDDSKHSEAYTNPVAYPAALPAALAVGALDYYPETGFIVADFSNIGPELDVVAPGVDIYSTYTNDAYAFDSGTSMATPFVTGLAARILAADPSLLALNDGSRSSRLTNILTETALDLGEVGFDSKFGFGGIHFVPAFETPRVMMNVNGETENKLDMSVTLATYSGDIWPANPTIRLAAYVQSFDDGSWSTYDDTIFELTDGAANIVFDYSNFEPGRYWLNTDEATVGDFVSDSLILYVPPHEPVASLPSGTYTESKTVSVTSATYGADIYYTLDGTDPLESKTAVLYEQPITISSTKTLKAYAVKNYIKSEVSEYTYTIQTSGFGAGPINNEPKKPDPVVKTENGLKTLSVKYDSDSLKKQLEQPGNDPIVLEALAEGEASGASRSTVDFPAAAASSSKPLVIRISGAEFAFEPGAISLPNGAKSVTFTAEQVNASSSGSRPNSSGSGHASAVWQLTLNVDGREASNFREPVAVTLTYDPSSIPTGTKVAAYRENEEGGYWTYLGGKLSADGKWTFETPHFSNYTIMYYDASFADLAGHWAQTDLTDLAARLVVYGTGPEKFSPDAGVTRAEFAAMLVRALELPKAAAAANFTDVAGSAWYADVIARAFGAGLVSGLGDGRFGPQEPISREQMAMMLVHAYRLSTGKSEGDIVSTQEVKFTDEGAVSAWARSEVRLADALGLMKGYPEGRFKPANGATRAEAGAAVKRLIGKLAASK